MPTSLKILSSTNRKIVLAIFTILALVLAAFLYRNGSLQITSQTKNSPRDDFFVPSELTTFEKVEVSTFDNLFTHLNSIVSPNSTYWDTWDYKNDFVQTEITKVYTLEDGASDELQVKISRPSDKEFSITKRVGVYCPKEKTALLFYKNLKYVDSNINILEQAKVGDFIYAKCLDENCDDIGLECALVYRDSN